MFGTLLGMTGFGVPEAGEYSLYRQMRCNPTLALARSIATAPMRAAGWSFGENEDAPKDAKDRIAAVLEPMRDWILHNCLYGLDYGWAPFEEVWEYEDGWLTPAKLKPLLVDCTEILRDKTTGVFKGLAADGGSTPLPVNKSFVYSYDTEAGNMYGRSRFENCRGVWNARSKLTERQGQYVEKVSRIIPMLWYPPGKADDESGTSQETFEIAKIIVSNAAQGKGIILPNELAPWAEEYMRKGFDPSKIRPWQLEFLTVSVALGNEFVEQGRYMDSQLMRGYLVPERAGIEGQFGTKAEAEAHTDIVLFEGQWVLNDLIRHLNWYIVDQILALNYGEATRGSVWIEAEPVVNEIVTFMRDLIKQVIGGDTIDVLERWVDLEQWLDQIGVPRKESIEPTEGGVVRGLLGGNDKGQAGRVAGMLEGVTNGEE